MGDLASVENQMLISVPVRPLAKGMHLDKIAQLLEAGAMVDVRGYHVTPYGLETEEGFAPVHRILSGAPVNYLRLEPLLEGELIQEYDVHMDSAGAAIMFAITNKFIYTTQDLAHWIPAPWVRSRVASSAAAGQKAVVDSSGYLLADKASSGFYVAFDRADGSAPFVSLVTAITDETHFTVAQDLPADLAPALTYALYAPLSAEDPLVVQYAKTPSFVLVCDGGARAGSFQAFDGHYIQPYRPYFEGNAEKDPFCAGARTVAYVGGRVLLGGTSEPTGRRRWRWSSATDLEMFNSEDYVDSTSSQGSILRITASEDYPVIFLDDGIVIGQPWGMEASSTDPWIWRPIASGGAAPVGPRAFCSIPGQIFFLGPDDLYTFSPLKRTEKGDYVVQPCKCAVRQVLTGNAATYKGRALFRYDPFNQRVIVATAQDPHTYSDLWSWTFGENEWAHRGRSSLMFTTISLFASRIGATWKSWIEAGYVWNDGSAASNAMKRSWLSWATGTTSIAFVCADAACSMYVGSRLEAQDQLVDRTIVEVRPTPIERMFETGDLDLGLPDEDKSFHKFALRLRDSVTRAAPIVFSVEGSTDKGRTWRQLGDLFIPVGEDEDEVHFAMRGTVARFRVRSVSTSGPWTLEEYTVRVRRAGRQIIRH